jgi:hypothetical protein
MYIGSQPSDRTSGAKPRDEFVGDGSTVNFTLSQEVPGGFESNVLVIVDNVLQQPVESYTIAGDNITLAFSEAPASGTIIYVLHQGTATYQMIPVVGSVTPDKLSENLRNFTVDTFTGNGSTTAYTLTATPASANSILVIVDGIVQTRTTNYSLSGTTLTFASAPDNGSGITVIHLGFSTVSRTAVPDGSITTAKIADNAITSAKLGFDVIVAEDIAANAITVSELQNGAVTPAKLSTGGPSWDTSNNLGINVTPNTWTLGKSVSVGDVGSAVFGFGGYNSLTSGSYFNSAWKYSSSSSSQKPALFVASDGAFSWSTAAAGTAGNNITFTEAMILNASGNVGINTASPSTRLEVTGSSGAPAVYIKPQGNIPNNNDNAGLYVLHQGTGGAAFRVRCDNVFSASQFAHILLNNASANSTALQVDNFGSGNIAQFTKSGTAALTVTANGIGLGATTPSSGTGIQFPATQSASSDANTLDDYEEGTWTPNVFNNGSSSSWTVKNGSYTKIGKIVYAYARLDGNNSGTAGGALLLSGLPFGVRATTGTWNHIGTYGASGSTVGVVTGDPSFGGNTVQLWNGSGQDLNQRTFVSLYMMYEVA